MKKYRVLIVVILMLAWLTPACMPKVASCGKPEVFCVGLVTDGGKIDDHSYNQAAWDGLRLAKSEGITDWIASIETVDVRDYDENLQVLGKAGYDVIVTVGPFMGDVTRAAAVDFPGAYFIGVDQDQSTNQEFLPNLVGLVFPEDQIGYLAGALAAELTQSGSIAAILASDASPAMQRYGLGFLAGAASVDSQVLVTVLYHNEVGLERSFRDPEWGAEQANTLVDNEVDIIFGAGGATGSNALVGAVMRGAYAIGSDTDEYYAFPVAAPHLYTSVLKLIAPALEDLIDAAKKAQAQTASFPGGNFKGRVGLAPFHDMDTVVPDEVKVHMDELTVALLTGDIQTGVP
jgi:basic membrane protein A and related proteins